MKHLKYFTVLLLTALLLLLPGCQKPDGLSPSASDGEPEKESGLSSIPTEETESLSSQTEKPLLNLNPGDSVSAIMQANAVPALLKIYGSMEITGSDQNLHFYFFTQSHKPDSVCYLDLHSLRDERVSGFGRYEDYFLNISDSHVKAFFPVEELSDFSGRSPENHSIMDSFAENAEITASAEKNGEWIIQTRLAEPFIYEDGSSVVGVVYHLEPGTLRILQIQNMLSETVCRESFTVCYGGKIHPAVLSCFSGWESPLRTLQYAYHRTNADGTDTEISDTIQIPDNWEFLPTGDQMLESFSDPDCTVPYSYPGDGKEYTIYIRNISPASPD